MRPLIFAVACLLAIALFAFAFVAAPHSCEWGLSAYVWAGLVVGLVLAALPMVMRARLSLRASLLWSGALVGLGAGAWLAGLFAANVRILCRLF